MKTQTKQRMIGGLVLAALMAIFLPMFFSNPHPSVQLSLSTQAPVEPARPKVRLQLPKLALSAPTQNTRASTLSVNTTPKTQVQVTALPAEPAMAITDHLQANPGGQQARAASVLAKQPAPPMPVDTFKSTASKAVKGYRQQAVRGVKTVSHKAKRSMPISAKNKRARGWILQLASFTDFSNAKRFVTRLNRSGFHPHSRIVTHGDGTQLTQVYVGPKTTRAGVERLQQNVRLRLKMTGLIRRSQS